MKINGKEVKGNKFAYDGCHKIYIIEDNEDLEKAINYKYKIYNIDDIKEIYYKSCDLRLINNWKLTEVYVPQFENAIFE